MNLQEIQNRLEELSAEMLTLSNQMARMISGASIIPSVPTLTSWKQLKEGDQIEINSQHGHGEYEVVRVESPSYQGCMQVSIKGKGRGSNEAWVDIEDLIRAGKVNLI